MTTEWREFAVSEYDYSTRDARRDMGVDQNDARLAMIFDGRWKYIHVENMRPMLFDLETDPPELNDLGADPELSDQISRMRDMHFSWARQHHSRITRSAGMVEKMTDANEPPGIIIGYLDKEELQQYGRDLPDHVEG